MHAEWEQEEALRHCVDELAKIDGLLPAGAQPPLPKDRVAEAIDFAQKWTPSVRKEATPPAKAKARSKTAPARYYGISVEVDLQSIVERHLPEAERADAKSLWSTLVKSSRVERHPHVTLVHRNELEAEDATVRAEKQAQWDRYAQLVDAAAAGDDSAEDGSPARALDVELTLGPRLAWDGRAMSIEVSALTPKSSSADPASTPSITLAEDRGAHITIGTRASDIRPVEGRWLMEAVMNGKKTTVAGGDIHVVEIEPVKTSGRLAGLS